MADTLTMSHNKGGLALRTVAHSHTISDVSSPTFVLRRLEDQSHKESHKDTVPMPDATMDGMHETQMKPGIPVDNHELENPLNGVNSNSYNDDEHSVIEHSLDSNSNPANSDDFRTPRGPTPEDDVVPPLEDRAAIRRNAFRSRAEGMNVLLRDDSLASDVGYSPSSSQLMMGSMDGAGIRDSQYFELEFARREAENEVEQMKLQLRSKNSQLEQVQMILMSYEEEIMKLRKTGLGPVAEGDSEDEDELIAADAPKKRENGPSDVALGIAEDLCKKIVLLQTNVQDLEEEMVRVKLENAQLRETNEFLKNSIQKSNRTTSSRGLRNPFSRHH